MYTNIGKLMTAKIRNYDLFHFSVRLNAHITALPGENPVLVPYSKAISQAVGVMVKVFSKSPKNPFTTRIRARHRERLNLLAALRRGIGLAQKMTVYPAKVEAANRLKQEMVEI